MSIALFKLENGHLSLEFEEADAEVVIAVIKQLFGEIKRKQQVLYSEIKFGGASFTYQNEWSNPCLISGTDIGDARLRDVNSKLTEK